MLYFMEILFFILIFWRHNYYVYSFVTTPSSKPLNLAPTLSPPPPTPSQPTILPICGSNNPSSSLNGFTRPLSNSQQPPHLRLRYQSSHIGVLPPIGNKAQLILSENMTSLTSSAIPSTMQSDMIGQINDYSNEEMGGGAPIFCSIRLEACASCVIGIEFEPPSFHFSEYEIEKISKCDEANLMDKACFDMEIIEERAEQSIPYLATLSGISDVYSRTSLWSFPNRNAIKTTANSALIVVALKNIQSNSQLMNYLNILFPINVVVYDNTEVIHGQPSESIFLANQTSIGFIQTPRYPDSYPRSIIKNYTLVNENKRGFVRLNFDDFHVHFQSQLKIIDSDGSELFNSRSEYRRPPALLSRSNKLTILFSGHDFTQIVGFRARYEFVETLSWPDKPTRRNCDDYLENYGGQISLDSQKTLLNKNIDCIWLIGRFPALSRTFDRIYLKVEEFRLQGVGLRLEVRRGPSSISERVLLLFDEVNPAHSGIAVKQPLDGLVTEDHVQPAFYVRLRGYLTMNTGLNIVYTQFYRWATALCPGGDGEFHCDNSKCIKSHLQCDGLDNCGDNSDEVCHLPDITFDQPKIDVGGILTLVIGAAGVIVLLLTMLAILSKLYRHGYFGGGRRRRTETNQTATGATTNAAMAHEAFCNELAPTIQTIGERRFYILPENQLSIIEAPPTYDAALKHPKVPDDGGSRNRRLRSRSAMAYVYTNEGYHRSPEDIPPRDASLSPPPFSEIEHQQQQPPSARTLTSLSSPCQQQQRQKRLSSNSTSSSNTITNHRSQSNPPSQQQSQFTTLPKSSKTIISPRSSSTPIPSPEPSPHQITMEINSNPSSPTPPRSSPPHSPTTTFSSQETSRPDTSRSNKSDILDESWV